MTINEDWKVDWHVAPHEMDEDQMYDEVMSRGPECEDCGSEMTHMRDSRYYCLDCEEEE